MSEAGLSKSQVAEYINRFPSARVCVLGDVMLDRYFWGEVDRISPEAPVPVVSVTRRSKRLGGAANVAANLRTLGVQVSLVGLIGDDRAGDELTGILDDLGIGAKHLKIEKGHETTEKVRIIAQSQQVVRADFEESKPPDDDLRSRMLAGVVDDHKNFDALIISDYGKGVVQESSIREIIAAWRKAGVPVLVDPHVSHFRWYNGASIVTPNTKEAASFYGEMDRKELFTGRAFELRESLGVDSLLITRGEDGMSLYMQDTREYHIPTVAKEVYDVTGAGDTVVSVLGAGLASGAPVLDSVIVANQAAGQVVREIGTTTVAPETLLSSF